ncbi:hypothetical protein BDN70DRAFT_809156 [Pholiota conissans]|uniref:Oxidoreductase AflY n=1 Tax=Pholiota conissans TaxID=109636 RepID=A0A9P5YYT4_9AGAR|nr:hypothetical protein BDN70DRAFT_809156 [Pholiota conissans]
MDFDLFPIPSRHGAPSQNLVLPRNKAGVSLASTTALQDILTDNHKRWHVFFNSRRFQNHTAYAVLTLWSLGVEPAILKGSYEQNVKIQVPAFPSPTSITHQTWKDHLGDDKYYQAYVSFFAEELKKKSYSKLLEEYVFEMSANVARRATADQPKMLDRLFAGLLHPMIHTGFGVEFTLPGMFAEGLALIAVYQAEGGGLLLAEWFNSPAPGYFSWLTSSVGILNDETRHDVHAFTIMARILEDPDLGGYENPGPKNPLPGVVHTYGKTILNYVDQWTLDGDVDKKVHELQWTMVLLYGVCGLESDENGQFNADLYLLHLVTSSLFLSQIFAELCRSSQILLLRGYFAYCMAWYVARGRPNLDIVAFFSDPNTLHPVPPGPRPTPHTGVNPSPSSPEAVTPNPWLPIIQSSLAHPDDHLPKLQRTLSEYAAHFGLTPAGTFKVTELKGAELIDGTLFIRAAGLTFSRLGWVREGEAPGTWNEKGFFKHPYVCKGNEDDW